MIPSKMVKHLQLTLGISPTMIASLLNVTENTLYLWSKEPIQSLLISKGIRLLRLVQAVDKAVELGVPTTALLSLLLESTENTEDSSSALYYIVDKPNDTNFFTTIYPSLVNRFINEINK